MMRPRPTAITLAFAFLSGVPGLGFQVLWAKVFSIALGREYPSVISASSAFLGGMALGAWLMRFRRRLQVDPFRLFVALEALSAAWILLLAVMSPALQEHFPRWIGLFPSPARHWFVAFITPFVLMLPVAVGQGMSILLLREGALPPDPIQQPISGLYASNTAGALVGLLVATFWLLPGFGARATAQTLAAVGAFTALIAWIACSSRSSSKAGSSARSPAPRHLSLDAQGRHAWQSLFLSGLLGVGYQMLVVRGLSRILENTVFTFAIALAVYLGFSALGAAWHQASKVKTNPDRHLMRALAMLMGCAFYGIAAMTFAESAYKSLRTSLGDSMLGVAAAECLIVSMVSAPVCFWMGNVFCGLWNRHAQSSTRDNSHPSLYAANLLGAAIGPPFMGLILLDLTGVKLALIAVSTAYLFLAPAIREWGWKAGLILATTLLATFLPFERQEGEDTVLASIEGAAVHASVIQSPNGQRTLRVNHRFQMGGTGAVSAQTRQAHIPLLLHPKPRNTLFLGMGTGITFAAAAAHPNLSGDGVELLPEVAELRSYFEPYSALPRSPDFRVFISDARRFVLTINTRYDVVVSDLFHPALEGSGALYTLEHFQAIKRLLSPEGLFCQWIPMHQVDRPTFNCIARTFLRVFPEAQAVMLRFALDAPVVGLVGGKFPELFDGWVESRLSHPPLAKELKTLALADTVRLQGCYLADTATLENWTHGSPVNTDDNQWVAFNAPAFSYQQTATSYGRFMELLLSAPEPSPAISSSSARNFIRARNVYLKGMVLESERKVPEALRAYVESARISRDFSLGYAQCLSLVPLLSRSQPRLTREILTALMEARPEQTIARDLLQRLETPQP